MSHFHCNRRTVAIGIFVMFSQMFLISQWRVGDAAIRRMAHSLDLPTENSIDYEHMYTLALAMLRCFTTPGCFPTASCRTGSPKKVQREGKAWEEQSFCVEDLKKTKGNCLVYSFGIDSSPEWEQKVARLFDCEVHAFDPTANHPTELAPGVTFHKLGLQGIGSDMSHTHAAEYAAIDSDLLYTLPEIMERLNHTGREIDVLMLDCEGCEWGVLKQMVCSGQSFTVKQIIAEFHFQKVLGLETESDVLNAADGITCLWQHRWNIVSMELSGAGPDDRAYTRGVSKIIHNKSMLMYIALQQTPPDELQVSEAMEQELTTEKERYAIQRMYEKKHQTEDMAAWPIEAHIEVGKLIKIHKDAAAVLHRVKREQAKFDQWPQLAED